jgi:alpha-galactosidase
MTQALSATTKEDMLKSRAWTGHFLAGPAGIPIAFKLDGQPVSGIPEAWKPVSRRRRIDANVVETVWEGKHPACGLGVRVECVEHGDYPVVEWTAWFTNSGSDPAPILSDVQALDAEFDGASPLLWHCNGDFYSETGYTREETPLHAGDTLSFKPAGGRACDHAFPYYRLAFQDCGLSIAIGWPAQWKATFAATDKGVRVTAGQEITHIRLQPGEVMRTPRITVMSWTGDMKRAANLWRRWYRAHVLPRSNGKPLGPRVAAHGTDDGEEFTAATEANQIKYIEKWANLNIPMDAWWIDAGWYPCYDGKHVRRWWETGTWIPDPERFPKGMKAVSDCAAKHGADLLVWFEPERVRPGSELDGSDFLLKLPHEDNRLLFLGNPSCRQWLTDHVCKVIQDNGIKIYRQDHNFEPLRFWRENEPADRQGMNENLHVQGYLRYWDDLLARNPGLWIDSCASGGRRNDMETMRRAVPLHYSDYGYGIHPVKLSFHHVLFEWIPYFKEVTCSWDLKTPDRWNHDEDRFSYHCGIGPMMMPAIDIKRDNYDYDLIREMIAIWKRAADMMIRGDYYPLTPIHRTPKEWVALQFDLPEESCGYVQGIHLPECPNDVLLVHPQGLVADAEYRFENAETHASIVAKGSAIASDGFRLESPKRSGVIWFYNRV